MPTTGSPCDSTRRHARCYSVVLKSRFLHSSRPDCPQASSAIYSTADADTSTVKHLAGHTSIETTGRYDRRGEGAKRTTADLLRVPADSVRSTHVEQLASQQTAIACEIPLRFRHLAFAHSPRDLSIS